MSPHIPLAHPAPLHHSSSSTSLTSALEFFQSSSSSGNTLQIDVGAAKENVDVGMWSAGVVGGGEGEGEGMEVEEMGESQAEGEGEGGLSLPTLPTLPPNPQPPNNNTHKLGRIPAFSSKRSASGSFSHSRNPSTASSTQSGISASVITPEVGTWGTLVTGHQTIHPAVGGTAAGADHSFGPGASEGGGGGGGFSFSQQANQGTFSDSNSNLITPQSEFINPLTHHHQLDPSTSGGLSYPDWTNPTTYIDPSSFSSAFQTQTQSTAFASHPEHPKPSLSLQTSFPTHPPTTTNPLQRHRSATLSSLASSVSGSDASLYNPFALQSGLSLATPFSAGGIEQLGVEGLTLGGLNAGSHSRSSSISSFTSHTSHHQNQLFTPPMSSTASPRRKPYSRTPSSHLSPLRSKPSRSFSQSQNEEDEYLPAGGRSLRSRSMGRVKVEEQGYPTTQVLGHQYTSDSDHSHSHTHSLSDPSLSATLPASSPLIPGGLNGTYGLSLSDLALHLRSHGIQPPPGRSDIDIQFLETGRVRDAAVAGELEGLMREGEGCTSNAARDKWRGGWMQRWIHLCYDRWVSCSVSRQGLYAAYVKSCEDFGMKPLNTASFGKAVRNAFPGIKTRRLGNRGNSKYHYVGLRPTTQRQAELLNDYPQSNGLWYEVPEGSMACVPAELYAAAAAAETGGEEGEVSEDETEQAEREEEEVKPRIESRKKKNLSISQNKAQEASIFNDKTPTAAGFRAPSHSNRLPSSSRRKQPMRADSISGTSSSSGGYHFEAPQPPEEGAGSVDDVEDFPMLEEWVDVRRLFGERESLARGTWQSVKDHLSTLLQAIQTFRFDTFEFNCRSFWPSLSNEQRAICQTPEYTHLIGRADSVVYDVIFMHLTENFTSTIPPSSQQALKTLGKNIEKILGSSLGNYDPAFYDMKIESAARFGHLLARFHDILETSLSLRSILMNFSQTTGMVAAVADNKMQWNEVMTQSALVLDTHPDRLRPLFVSGLQRALEEIATRCRHATKATGATNIKTLSKWVDEVAAGLLEINGNAGGNNGYLPPKTMLVNFCWLTTQMLRDMTLRSEPLFGIFQMVKSFADDWVALSVLRKTCLTVGSVSNSVQHPSSMQNGIHPDGSLVTGSSINGWQPSEGAPTPQGQVQGFSYEQDPSIPHELPPFQEGHGMQLGANGFQASYQQYSEDGGQRLVYPAPVPMPTNSGLQVGIEDGMMYSSSSDQGSGQGGDSGFSQQHGDISMGMGYGMAMPMEGLPNGAAIGGGMMGGQVGGMMMDVQGVQYQFQQNEY